MKLPNKYGATVVASTEDLMDLLQNIFDNMVDPADMDILEAERESFQDEKDALQNQIDTLKDSRDRFQQLYLGASDRAIKFEAMAKDLQSELDEMKSNVMNAEDEVACCKLTTEYDGGASIGSIRKKKKVVRKVVK